MTDAKVMTIQDISCYGQCSLTVALPIISACGIETAILPSAVLSHILEALQILHSMTSQMIFLRLWSIG